LKRKRRHRRAALTRGMPQRCLWHQLLQFLSNDSSCAYIYTRIGSCRGSGGAAARYALLDYRGRSLATQFVVRDNAIHSRLPVAMHGHITMAFQNYHSNIAKVIFSARCIPMAYDGSCGIGVNKSHVPCNRSNTQSPIQAPRLNCSYLGTNLFNILIDT
jgi:hypothetical protein